MKLYGLTRESSTPFVFSVWRSSLPTESCQQMIIKNRKNTEGYLQHASYLVYQPISMKSWQRKERKKDATDEYIWDRALPRLGIQVILNVAPIVNLI